MSRYVVTNAEFGRYLAASGGARQPEYWGNGLYNQPGQPVTGVSWSEARCNRERILYEWVEDDWHENYQGAPCDGSAWIDEPRAADRVFRASEIRFQEETRDSWIVRHAIAAAREFNPPEVVSPEIGFRVVCA